MNQTKPNEVKAVVVVNRETGNQCYMDRDSSPKFNEETQQYVYTQPLKWTVVTDKVFSAVQQKAGITNETVNALIMTANAFNQRFKTDLKPEDFAPNQKQKTTTTAKPEPVAVAPNKIQLPQPQLQPKPVAVAELEQPSTEELSSCINDFFKAMKTEAEIKDILLTAGVKPELIALQFKRKKVKLPKPSK